eukprot:TRINITY_DN37895_c0_g1_i1.p1 TRINITY_DN37895_c0_g1~~TRINITY_DN37895_c0_g1_i1.p1  ORF type:complete len:438 (+),score=79.04 TRINITY_DN37895_c0_g1_i1:64-1314(+)
MMALRSGGPSLPALRGASKTRPDDTPKDMVLRPKDTVPEGFRDMHYWRAMQTFKTFDALGEGNLSKESFGRMMRAIVGPHVKKDHIEEQFAAADLDNSGGIDCFEFLGWVFGTDSNYCGSVRKRLSGIEPARVIEYYKNLSKAKKDDPLLAYGVIDKEEFYNFMLKFSPIKMDRKASNGLFNYIDVDKSGGIDVKEFLDWIKAPDRTVGPGAVPKAAPDLRRTTISAGDSRMGSKQSSMPSLAAGADARRMAATDSLGSRSGSKSLVGGFGNDKANPIAAGEKKQSDLFEQPPGKAVTLEFTIGGNCDGMMRAIEKAVRKTFENEVEIRTTYDVNCQGCRKVNVLVGRGILLWDRYSMMSHMDDPFQNVETAKQWTFELLRACIPNLLGTVNLRKAERSAKKNERLRSLHRRNTVA